MIGVDLVDRHQATLESNWKRRGFLDKLFCKDEQALINKHPDPEQIIWLLWSMKEAAYKIYSRKLDIRSFAPAKIHCHPTDLTSNRSLGIVCITGETFYTSSNINKALIYSTAAENNDKLNAITVNIYDLNTITDYQSLKPQSVSHHGKFLALAYIEETL
jgi:phosphopantetheinyl transferase (holo-ACP synthase)